MRYLVLILVIVLVLLATGCGRGSVVPAVDQGEFLTWVERFEEAATSQGFDLGGRARTVAFEYVDIAKDTTALCHTDLLSGPVIRINRANWEKRNDTDREVVFFHEMGHCALGRGHRDGQATNYMMPVSLMNSDLVQGNLYKSKRSYYLDELFHE